MCYLECEGKKPLEKITTSLRSILFCFYSLGPSDQWRILEISSVLSLLGVERVCVPRYMAIIKGGLFTTGYILV